jgi:hypothetical protein
VAILPVAVGIFNGATEEGVDSGALAILRDVYSEKAK